MNKEAYKFFLMAVEDATLRTRYYNGEKNLLKQCSASEKQMRDYMNNKLAVMRKLGFQNVPADIPQREYKKRQ